MHTPASMTSAFADIADFLAQERIALIGASLDAKDVSRTVLRELIAAGYDVVPVNTRVSPGDHIDGRAAFAHVGDIARSAEPVAGALLMVPSNAAAESSAPGARDEEEDDDADDAADGTQRNDAEGGSRYAS